MNWPACVLDNVSLTLGAFSLQRMALTIAPGEIWALLGPNGAGKSVTLETIAGFHRPHSGRIFIAGRDVTELPPERRDVALVLQNYGLFPHLTVARNVAFGLGIRSPDVRRELERFGIAHLSERRPPDLSPGEKQRTALARALIRKPALFLFDEPFAALDARTREDLREELLTFLRETGVVAIFVTHDQTDATVLADRVAIMQSGAIVQAGRVMDVLAAPANSFVAEFLGVENLLLARVVGRTGPFVRVAVGARFLNVHDGAEASPTSETLLCIRGEEIALSRSDGGEPGSTSSNRLAMRIVRVTSVGPFCKVLLDGGFPLIACLTRRTARELGLAPGDDAVVEIAPDSIHMVAAG
ncbi:MAG: ABC transporter ATP-binding protein [Acetobacteraceae bacterium]